MNTLNNYIQDAQSACFKKYGAFFAFGQKQFDEQKKEGVKYASNEIGLIYPIENRAALYSELAAIHKSGVEQDMAENGKTAIIQRELDNHEASYTGEIDDTADALASYPITREEILAVFSNQQTCANY